MVSYYNISESYVKLIGAVQCRNVGRRGGLMSTKKADSDMIRTALRWWRRALSIAVGFIDWFEICWWMDPFCHTFASIEIQSPPYGIYPSNIEYPSIHPSTWFLFAIWYNMTLPKERLCFPGSMTVKRTFRHCVEIRMREEVLSLVFGNPLKRSNVRQMCFQSPSITK